MKLNKKIIIIQSLFLSIISFSLSYGDTFEEEAKRELCHLTEIKNKSLQILEKENNLDVKSMTEMKKLDTNNLVERVILSYTEKNKNLTKCQAMCDIYQEAYPTLALKVSHLAYDYFYKKASDRDAKCTKDFLHETKKLRLTEKMRFAARLIEKYKGKEAQRFIIELYSDAEKKTNLFSKFHSYIKIKLEKIFNSFA